MTKQNHKTGFLVAAMIFSAIFLRVLGKFDILIVPGGIARSLIYIALYTRKKCKSRLFARIAF